MGIVDGHSSLANAIARGMRIVDERTGIIQGIYDLPLETNDPKLFHVAAPLADTYRYFGSIRCFRHNGGAALTRERATMAAIGEAIERYCAGMYDPDSLIEAKADDLGEEAVPPWRFVLFSEKQYERDDFPLSKPRPDTVFRWARGRSLTGGKDVYVPACFVYVPYQFSGRDEFITIPISTGLACGSSYEDAVLRGILEVVERDAFTITWLNRMPVPRVEIDQPKNAELAAVVERFREVDLDICVNLTTTGLGIPVVITMSLDGTGAGPATVIAARADFDVEWAILRSLEETAQTRLWAKKLMRDYPDFKPSEGYANTTDGERHVRLFADPEMRCHVDFLTGAPAVQRLSEIEPPDSIRTSEKISRCIEMLSAEGFEVVSVDVTTPDIAEIGFRVVRVLIPGLHPLDMDHNWRYLGGTRLYETPFRMGFVDHVRSEEELNPVPHPFP